MYTAKLRALAFRAGGPSDSWHIHAIAVSPSDRPDDLAKTDAELFGKRWHSYSSTQTYAVGAFDALVHALVTIHTCIQCGDTRQRVENQLIEDAVFQARVKTVVNRLPPALYTLDSVRDVIRAYEAEFPPRE